MDTYKDHGYNNRGDYLKSLANQYGVDLGFVIEVSDLLGPNEDFDGLVTSIQDYADE